MRTASSCAKEVRREHSVQPPATRASMTTRLLNEAIGFFLKVVSSPSSAISKDRGTQEIGSGSFSVVAGLCCRNSHGDALAVFLRCDTQEGQAKISSPQLARV